MPDQLESPKNELKMKTIADLNGLHFVIPSYQRGYRWRKEQVQDLIQDIQDFSKELSKNNGEKKDAFYCLQPIVVKPRKVEAQLDCSFNTTESEVEGGEIQVKDSDGKVLTYKYDSSLEKFTAIEYEVIDGQQRLTTIFLILKSLKEVGILKEDISFNLRYDTRPKTTDALNDPLKKASDNRIDEWHIKEAWSLIKESKSIPDKAWKDVFLYQTKVIWYEPEGLGDNNDSIKIFSRLNVGKIPLTNSELIRALFIIETKGKPPAELNEYKIASEWDFIEQQLHNDEFWCFCNLGEPFKKEYSNRIEFFFNLIEQRPENKTDQSHQTYSTFAMYSKKIADKEQVDKLWQEIKDLYYRFHEWFIDNSLYHLIGFVRLNSSDNLANLTALLDLGDSEKQSELIFKLRNEIIKNKWKNVKKDADLKYGSQHIKPILLLHNILTSERQGERFPFRKYIESRWDIEHVHALNDKIEPIKRKEYINTWIEYFNKKESSSDNKADLPFPIDFDKKNPESDNSKLAFADFVQKCNDLLDEGDISNLVLLDQGTNRSYKDAPFPDKRTELLKKEKEGKIFLPICTRNVFTKSYSYENVSIDFWTPNDRKNYSNDLLKVVEISCPWPRMEDK